MSRREDSRNASRKAAELVRVIHTRFPHPTMRWPSLDFVAGVFMGAVLAIVEVDEHGKMCLSWKPIEGSEHGDCEIQFVLATEMVLNDIEFAKSIVEMYGWEWVDMSIGGNGLVTVQLRPLYTVPQNGEYVSGDESETQQFESLETKEKTETDKEEAQS